MTCSPSALVSIKQTTLSFRHNILVYNTFNNRAESTCNGLQRECVMCTYLHIIIILYDIHTQTGDKKWRSDCRTPLKRLLCGRFFSVIFFLLFIYSYYRRLSLPGPCPDRFVGRFIPRRVAYNINDFPLSKRLKEKPHTRTPVNILLSSLLL